MTWKLGEGNCDETYFKQVYSKDAVIETQNLKCPGFLVIYNKDGNQGFVENFKSFEAQVELRSYCSIGFRPAFEFFFKEQVSGVSIKETSMSSLQLKLCACIEATAENVGFKVQESCKSGTHD